MTATLVLSGSLMLIPRVRGSSKVARTVPRPVMVALTTAPGRDDGHRTEGAGEDDLPCAERLAELAGMRRPASAARRVGRPGRPHLIRSKPRRRRAASSSATSTGAKLGHGAAHGAKDEQAARRVVGDGVAEGDVPAGDAAVDDLEGGDRVGHRRRAPGGASSGPASRSAPSTKAISASTLGCSSRLLGTTVVPVDVHVVEQSTPKSGWSTPSCSWTAGEVRPILRPTTWRRRRALRTSSCWTA